MQSSWNRKRRNLRKELHWRPSKARHSEICCSRVWKTTLKLAGAKLILMESEPEPFLEWSLRRRMAQAAQSMLALPDGNMIDTTRKAKVQRTDGDGFEVDLNPATESQSKKNAKDQSDKILQQMALVFDSVQLLEDQMKAGFETEGLRRKEDYKNLDYKMVKKMEE